MTRFARLFFLVFSVPALAQFSGLVTTTDGSQLYFSSKLRLHGTDESDAPKIFHHASRFDLFREVPRDASQLPATTNFYKLVNPSVSADGRIVVYTGEQDCYITQGCPDPSYQLNLVGASLPADAWTYGPGFVSPDGRYLLNCCLQNSAETGSLYDLTTGLALALPGPQVGDLHQVFGDDGAFLAGAAIYRLTRPQSPGTPVGLSGTPIEERLSRDVSTILYMMRNGANVFEVIAHDIPTGRETILDQNAREQEFLWISGDGKLALYLSSLKIGGPLQVFVQATDGSNRRLIGNLPEGFNAATMSGDGRVAYAATPLGRLLRIDLQTGATRQLTGPVPFVTDLQPCCVLGDGSVAPGSVAWILGSGFEGVGGAKPSVLVNGIKSPVFERSDGYLRFQIPWETPVNQRISLEVESAPQQPFESVRTADSSETFPSFLYLDAFGQTLTLFHQDFSALVTAGHPAASGEFIHFYMIGLGPLSPPLATGERGKGSPLSILANPIACSADVKFAGAAPGLTGVYQLDVRAPVGAEKGFVLTCTITDSSGKTWTANADVP